MILKHRKKLPGCFLRGLYFLVRLNKGRSYFSLLSVHFLVDIMGVALVLVGDLALDACAAICLFSLPALLFWARKQGSFEIAVINSAVRALYKLLIISHSLSRDTVLWRVLQNLLLSRVAAEKKSLITFLLRGRKTFLTEEYKSKPAYNKAPSVCWALYCPYNMALTNHVTSLYQS